MKALSRVLVGLSICFIYACQANLPSQSNIQSSDATPISSESPNQSSQSNGQEIVFQQWFSDAMKGGDGSQFFCDDNDLKYAKFYSPRKAEILDTVPTKSGETQVIFRLESSREDGSPIIKDWSIIIGSSEKGYCVNGILNDQGQFPAGSDEVENWFDKNP